MAEISEIDAMKSIEETLSKIEDTKTRDRILRWIMDKFSTEAFTEIKDIKTTGKVPKKKAKKATSKKTTFSIVGDLNLKPQNKKSLLKFVSEKNPINNNEKLLLCVYYLKNELSISEITTSHIYTCFKDQNWRVPSDLSNALQFVASKKGWLNTSNMNNIELTTIGENYIEHDLPKKTKPVNSNE